MSDSAGQIHVFTTQVPVRWSDVDAMGYVNNSRYFTYFEQARVQWLQSMDEDFDLQQVGMMVAHASCDFRRPLPYPATLEIDIYADPPGQTSLKTYYEVRVEDDGSTLYAQGEAVLVWISAETERPKPLPEAFRNALPEPSSSA